MAATTIVAQRALQYGTELASALVSDDHATANKLRRRLELSMTMAGSEDHMHNLAMFHAQKDAEAIADAQQMASAVYEGNYRFLSEPYGATNCGDKETRKRFGKDLKLLKKLFPAVHSKVLLGANATHLNEYQVRGLLRKSVLCSAYDYHTMRGMFNKSSTNKKSISVLFDNDARYMMSAQAGALPDDDSLKFPVNYKSAGALQIAELAEYGGYYCDSGKPLSLKAGQIPYFISYTSTVTLPKDSSALFKYDEGGCGGFVEFPKDVPIVMYDLTPGTVYTRLTPFLVPQTAWQNHTPEQIGNRRYLQYIEKQAHTSEHDRALTKYIAACSEVDTVSIQAVPHKSLLRIGYDKNSTVLLNRILSMAYENNPMYATCDFLYGTVPTMYPRNLLPGMLVRADMIAKASDTYSGQGALMCISQPASEGAIGMFYSGYDKKLHTHTMDVAVLPNALSPDFEPSEAMEQAEVCGTVSIFSHMEHEAMLMFFCAHRPDIYSKLTGDELWGDTGDYADYTDWCGDLERLFISIVGVYAKLYDEKVGNTIHSLGMVYGDNKAYNVLDMPTMMQEIHASDKHREFIKSQEFKSLGQLVFGSEFFEELFMARILSDSPDVNMPLRDISKFKCKCLPPTANCHSSFLGQKNPENFTSFIFEFY